jgi:integrase
MLHIYTRHAADCSHANDTQWRRCRCSKWLRGVLPNGETLRESAGTRSWEQAERNARKKEVEADPTRVDQVQPRRETVKEAIRMCLEDEEARGLELSSRKKSRTLLNRQFLPFCEARKFVHIDQVLPIDMTEFRSTWNNGEATTHRKHERMHSFFVFCVANDMLRKNPMDALKKPKTPDVVPTDYFLPEEFEQIVAATEKYEYGGGNDSEHRGQRLRALSLLMRWSGLAILDATSLERERLSTNENDDDQIFLYRAKTGVPVFVVIPNEVGDTLRQLPNSNPRYFFWSGNGDPRSAAKAFQRSYWKLFKLADIQKPDGTPKRCHPHMFRDTFAVELLLAGVPLDQVSLLLGHSSVKITERHYAPFCKARQEQLAISVKLAWKKPTQSVPEKKDAVNKKRVRRQNSERVQEMA